MASRTRGFTLIELLVVVAIVGLLAGMLLVAVRLVLESARSTACKSMQRQWGMAMMLYAGNNEGLLVGSIVYDYEGIAGNNKAWHQFYGEFTMEGKALAKERCSKNTGGTYGIYYNTSAANEDTWDKGVIFDYAGSQFQSLTNLSRVYHPTDFMLLGCSSAHKVDPTKTGDKAYTSGGNEISALSFRASPAQQEQGLWMAHRNAANVVCADGHVEAVNPARAITLSNRQDRSNPLKTGIRAYKLNDGTPVVIVIP